MTEKVCVNILFFIATFAYLWRWRGFFVCWRLSINTNINMFKCWSPAVATVYTQTSKRLANAYFFSYHCARRGMPNAQSQISCLRCNVVCNICAFASTSMHKVKTHERAFWSFGTLTRVCVMRKVFNGLCTYVVPHMSDGRNLRYAHLRIMFIASGWRLFCLII